MSQPSSAPQAGLFIVSTGLEKVDPLTRRTIRSHVMRGKNTRKSGRATPQRRLIQDGGAGESQSEGREVVGTEQEPWILTSPEIVSTQLAIFGGVDEMKPYMMNLLYQALTIIKPPTYTLEFHLVDGPKANMFCFSHFPSNPALLHAILFVTQAFQDRAQGLPFGNKAQFHLAKALLHLQSSINNDKTATSNCTITAVVSLATAAAILGDNETLEKHMAGLCRMIELRGGIETFERGSLIESKASRIDLGLALTTGGKLRLSRPDALSWGPQIAQGMEITKLPELKMFHPRPDPRLLNIWADLRVFSQKANEATVSGVKMSQDFFARLSAGVPPRLIELQGEYDPGSPSELLRLCMLAYMKCLLMQVRGFGHRLKSLAEVLKNVLLEQPTPLRSSPELVKFLLWAYFISAISIFEHLDDHEWLRSALTAALASLHLSTWQETRKVLKGYLWVDVVYNDLGKYTFDRWLLPEN